MSYVSNPTSSLGSSGLVLQMKYVIADSEVLNFRYHIGESQLASMRHFLRFIDLEKEFDAFGFQRKV